MLYLLKNAESEITQNTPWCDDTLKRSTTAEKLTKIIATTTQPFVVSIDAPFGAGKSFFLKRWKQQLQNDGWNVMYFNAWETDYARDPLMAFLATLDEEFFKDSPIADDAKKTTAAGKQLLKSIAFNAVEAATVGLVKSGDWDKAKAAMETVHLKNYEEFKTAKKCIGDFKKTLREYGEKLRGKDDSNRPIIIFVDELDRCRPNYAIELLEVIKHLFNIENYVFVLGIDKKQIISSVGAVYGQTVDGEAYLKKFIDWNYLLPKPDTRSFIELLYKKFSLGTVMKQGEDTVRGGEDLIKSFYQLSKVFGLSLRDIEQYFTGVNLLIRFFGEKQAIFPMLLTLLFILRDIKTDIYSIYCTQPEKESIVIDYLKTFPMGSQLLNDEYGEWLEVWLIVAAASSGSLEARIRTLETTVAAGNATDKIKLTQLEHAQQIYKYLSFDYGFRGTRGHIANYLYQNIEDISRS